MANVELRLDRRFYKQAKGVFEKYEFDVGILQDGIHKKARPQKAGLKSYAGGPARKQSGMPDGKTLTQLSQELRERIGVNFYLAPFQSKMNADILKFTKSFFELCTGKTQKRRCENLLQAIVRNPILRGDYGSNRPLTQKIKGFNRLLIDTAQFFKAIKARVRTKNV